MVVVCYSFFNLADFNLADNRNGSMTETLQQQCKQQLQQSGLLQALQALQALPLLLDSAALLLQQQQGPPEPCSTSLS
jgi:hypothetical protein